MRADGKNTFARQRCGVRREKPNGVGRHDETEQLPHPAAPGRRQSRAGSSLTSRVSWEVIMRLCLPHRQVLVRLVCMGAPQN